MITKDFYSIAVAGTHGKTSTSSLIAHLLKSAGKPVAAFLGGITQNYNSNLILPGKSKEATIVVVEADEFDRSFLRLHPNEAVVTSADPDHLDIYGDEATILTGFRDFIKLLDKKGKLYIQAHAWYRLGENLGISSGIREYGLRSNGIHAENIIAKPGIFLFDYVGTKSQIKGLELHIPGFHNVENALVAIAVAIDHGVTEDQIRTGIKTFKGVKRRFEIHSNAPGHIYIDDYAIILRKSKLASVLSGRCIRLSVLRSCFSLTYLPGPEILHEDFRKVFPLPMKWCCLTFIRLGNFQSKE